MFIQFYKDFLGQVFRLGAIADQAVEQAVNTVVMAVKKCLEGVGIPLPDTLQQQTVG